MKQYIGFLSLVYIIAIIVKLKDNTKSFDDYITEYEDIKSQLKLAGQQKNPFLMLKFVNFIFYLFLILYYIANSILFENYLLLQILSYGLILICLFKLGRKLVISSVDDFEARIKHDRKDYNKKQRLKLMLGLLEFAYAFNALSLLSLYY
ncbi:hypothetical protein MWH28_08585 [Natroniella sulfidigena]|uniref:hypothetical protein n=1 Tax=Natroniella sulfidigena TaxID=723921 RepID=UPI00200A3B5F|nr:hypothetical protein [Natroniella sulfidigena]MCK8817413.1 hypothetical protein [Natroniella sulfidigena]